MHYYGCNWEAVFFSSFLSLFTLLLLFLLSVPLSPFFSPLPLPLDGDSGKFWLMQWMIVFFSQVALMEMLIKTTSKNDFIPFRFGKVKWLMMLQARKLVEK